jgi:hypothetical protein
MKNQPLERCFHKPLQVNWIDNIYENINGCVQNKQRNRIGMPLFYGKNSGFSSFCAFLTGLSLGAVLGI